jgi:hypothetical protein
MRIPAAIAMDMQAVTKELRKKLAAQSFIYPEALLKYRAKKRNCHVVKGY